MKLNAMLSQEIKSVLTSENKLSQVPESNSFDAADIATNVGKDSKLGEFYNQSSQVKQNLLAKLQTGTPASGFGTEATVTKTGDKVIIETTKKDDKIGVMQDAKTGDVTIEVNGKQQTFTGKDKDNLTIKAGDGNDTVTVGKGVTVKLTIDGGDGDDQLQGGDGDDTISGGKGNDTIEAGAGDDTVDGGEGRDYINGSKGKDKLAGGAGNDVIYGGDDDDAIDGGDGDDYLEGSKGNDTITGGKGKDILSGGLGDDTLKGGDGDDVIYAGQGKDNIFGEKGSNKIFSQAGDTDDSSTKGVKNTVVTVELSKAVGSKVIVSGTPEFKERVEADIEMLRSSETGRKMLNGMDSSGKTLTIVEFHDPRGDNMVTIAQSILSKTPDPKTSKVDTWGHLDATTGKSGSADDVVIGCDPYTPLHITSDVPPTVALYHEMSHAYNIMTGTMQNDFYKGDGGTASADNDNPVKDKNGKIIEDPNINVRNSERQAVGLSNDGVGFNDDDGDDANNDGLKDGNPKQKATPKTKNNPTWATENSLRDEFEMRKRNYYRKP